MEAVGAVLAMTNARLIDTNQRLIEANERFRETNEQLMKTNQRICETNAGLIETNDSLMKTMGANDAEVVRLRVLLDERHADLGAMTKHRDELLVRTMDPLRLVRAAKALESWLAGSHFTIGDPMTVAISVLEAADGDESDSRKATDVVGEN